MVWARSKDHWIKQTPKSRKVQNPVVEIAQRTVTYKEMRRYPSQTGFMNQFALFDAEALDLGVNST